MENKNRNISLTKRCAEELILTILDMYQLIKKMEIKQLKSEVIILKYTGKHALKKNVSKKC